MPIKVANIRLELDESEDGLPAKIAARLGVPRDAVVQWRILRKSLDARGHDDIHFKLAAVVDVPEEELQRIGASPGLEPYVPERFQWPEPGSMPLSHRPVIVGAGPAGLFAGYLLAKDGYRPLILERGRAVKDRVADVRRFDENGPLDPESNYLFGEGGAGTFSDGKLTSRNTGPDVTRVLEILADCHGKPSIVYEHRPHLGSNRLPLVVRTLRRKFEEMGGEIRFSCRVEDLDIADGRLQGLSTSSGYIAAELAVLAIGHSARDTYGVLLHRGVPMEAKPFQLGVRIEQPQAAIDGVRYGLSRRPPGLGRGRLQRIGPRRPPRPVYLLHVRRGLRDAQCQRAGALLHQRHEREPARFTVRQQRPCGHHRTRGNRQLAPPGRDPLPATGRAPGVRGRRTFLQSTDPMGSRFPGRPAEPR